MGIWQAEKHIMVFRVAALQGGQAEADAHKLEVVYAKIKIRQLVDKENAAIGGNASAGLSNSMVGGFGGATGMNGGAGGGGAGAPGGSRYVLLTLDNLPGQQGSSHFPILQ